MSWVKTGSLKGPAGDSVAYVHQQTSPAATWTIPHGLGREPHMVTVFQNGEQVFTDTDVDPVHVVLTFPSPETGEAHIL